MAVTSTYEGSLSLRLEALAKLAGDYDGLKRALVQINRTFAPAGGSAPTISGFLFGTATVTTTPTDVLLAHATDPLQGLGDATYPDGFTVAGAKLKGLWLRNNDTVDAVLVERAAANGLPVFDAAGDGISIPAGGEVWLYLPAGTAALSTGSNDALTLTAAAGTCSLEILAIYGP